MRIKILANVILFRKHLCRWNHSLETKKTYPYIFLFVRINVVFLLGGNNYRNSNFEMTYLLSVLEKTNDQIGRHDTCR